MPVNVVCNSDKYLATFQDKINFLFKLHFYIQHLAFVELSSLSPIKTKRTETNEHQSSLGFHFITFLLFLDLYLIYLR